MAIVFTSATLFPLFDTAKKVPPSRTIGNTYAIIPNNPKKKELTALPTVPPIPKLLINSKIETATTIQSAISFSKEISGSACFFGVFFLPREFVVLRFVFFPVLLFRFPVAKLSPSKNYDLCHEISDNRYDTDNQTVDGKSCKFLLTNHNKHGLDTDVSNYSRNYHSNQIASYLTTCDVHGSCI